MQSRTLSHLLTNYGMAIVLLLLCIFYSFVTLRPQELSSATAAKYVLRKLPAIPEDDEVLIVASVSKEDREFWEAVSEKLHASHWLQDPPSARYAIAERIEKGPPLKVIVASETAAKWLPSSPIFRTPN